MRASGGSQDRRGRLNWGGTKAQRRRERKGGAKRQRGRSGIEGFPACVQWLHPSSSLVSEAPVRVESKLGWGWSRNHYRSTMPTGYLALSTQLRQQASSRNDGEGMIGRCPRTGPAIPIHLPVLLHTGREMIWKGEWVSWIRTSSSKTWRSLS